jgi:cytochrome P450
MLIPKDATIFIPAYALHQTHYPDPETYNPDRYLNHPKPASHYAASPDYANRDHYAYGAGRRICVGIHLAERTQWKLVASLLWAFSIEQVVDEEGRVCELDPDAYTEGLTYEPLPFRVKMVVRSERHAEVVRRGFEGIRDFLKEWE